MSTDLTITNGPSREEFFDALRLRGEERRVTFAVFGRIRTMPEGEAGSAYAEEKIQATVIGVKAPILEEEDVWVLELTGKSRFYPRPRIFSARYNSRQRKGSLIPID
jgi:hypothetical protein